MEEIDLTLDLDPDVIREYEYPCKHIGDVRKMRAAEALARFIESLAKKARELKREVEDAQEEGPDNPLG